MPIRDLWDLTYEEVGALERARTVAVLPVGAIEAHGPHLPLATDAIIAHAMARAGAEAIEARGWRTLQLPALPYSAAPFAAAFTGTLSVSPNAVTTIVRDLGLELTRHGFAALAVANAHLDPAHLAALRDAAGQAHAAGARPVVCPDVSRRPWAERLSEEFRSGACHAGRYEGSIVMAERPDLVREAEMRSLPSNPASLASAIREGRTSFAAAGGPRAYFGWPAEATAEEGRATIAALGAILADAVSEALGAGA